MFIIKKNYYLIIEDTKDISLSNIKKKDKFSIIYRKKKIEENILDLTRFRFLCKAAGIRFYIANDFKFAIDIKADGLYISSYNRDLKFNRYISEKFKIIGSAHNFKELEIKRKQGCTNVFLSRLFETNYKEKKGHLGLIKYNLITSFLNKYQISPLGGIRLSNLNYLKNVNGSSFAILSEVKKKPAKIFSRLF